MKQPLVAASKPASSAASEHAHGAVKGHSNQENAAPNLNKIPSARDVTAVSSKPATKADSSAHTNDANTEASKLLQEISSLKGTNTNLTQSITDMRTEMDGLEKERDFYFDKLREIEVLLQDIEDKNSGNELTAAIFKILYATIDGFEPVLVSDEATATNAADELAR
jgi:RP/EB family microtubule-associated protein